MGTSIIIPTFQRDDLLELTLPITVNYLPIDSEIVVINDGLPGRTKEICQKNGVKYLFSGKRNIIKLRWRCSSWAYNIGIKQAKYENLILTCPEMLHLNNCIQFLSGSLKDKEITIPVDAMDDLKGIYLNYFKKYRKHDEQIYQSCSKLNTKLNFLVGIKKWILLEIGGFDEDFIGHAFDDTDLMGRLVDYGCQYTKTKAKTIHLYHNRHQQAGRNEDYNEKFQYNKNLFESRKGQIIRNQGKSWGEL